MDRNYIVESVFEDGTIKAVNSEGKSVYAGLAIETSRDGTPENLYLVARTWNDQPEPPSEWQHQMQLTGISWK